MAPTPSAATLVVAAGLLASCEEPNTTVASLPFDEVFQLAEVVELGEDPSDSVAEVGVFLERRNGGFIVADRLLPRVRTYQVSWRRLSADSVAGLGNRESTE